MTTPSILTFVGKSFARKGFRFYYEGKDAVCPSTCKLLQTCQTNLQPKQVYEIVQVMTKEHTCPHELHEEDMLLVKIKVPDLVVSMENKIVFEGSVVSYVPIKCELDTCPYHEFCVPELIVAPGDRLKVKERLEKIKNCPKGYSLSKVSVEKK